MFLFLFTSSMTRGKQMCVLMHPEVHPRLFCLSIKLSQMFLHDLPSSTILVPRDLMPGWSAIWEDLKENVNQKPTESSGGCGIFTIAKDPEYFAVFCHVEM